MWKIYSHEIDDFEDDFPGPYKRSFQKNMVVSLRAKQGSNIYTVQFHFLMSFPSEGRKLFSREIHPRIVTSSALRRASQQIL